ncbi:MAG: helix-turn-helix transcriptional regulator [Chloroflexi bacterium]|nr:helix-turn-helix transcriptional regulator [Chloroflexota bacterium]
MTTLPDRGPRLYIRERREALGLSLRALADRAGVDFAAIDKIERGERDPRLSSLAAIAKGLGVEVADLFRRPRVKRKRDGP